MNCPRCRRRTAAARGACIYCGETLPISQLTSAPPQRNLDAAEHAFNTILEPPRLVASEAALAALYLEHGFEAVEPAIVGAFNPRIEYALTTHVDYKTELQVPGAPSLRALCAKVGFHNSQPLTPYLIRTVLLTFVIPNRAESPVRNLLFVARITAAHAIGERVRHGGVSLGRNFARCLQQFA